MSRQTALGSAAAEVSYCSSLREDVWHELTDPQSFESWHFDAVSDDGAEALSVTFYDNYVLSPRFHGTAADGSVALPGHRYPAISLAYSADGATVVDVVNEFEDGSFTASRDTAECCIGGSSFRYGGTQYGTGFSVVLDLEVGGGRRIKGTIEWLVIEADLQPDLEGTGNSIWDLVIPRADVTGKLTLLDAAGKLRQVLNFRGTGFHDHILSRQLHYRDLNSRMWGRAHFTDTTVVFERHGGVRDPGAPGRFFVVENGRISDRPASCQALGHRRDRWGLLIPQQVWFRAKDGLMVRVRPLKAISSGIYETKMLSEVRLGLKDGRERKSIGITEFVNPQRLRSGVFRWVGGFGIKRAEERADPTTLGSE